MLYLLFYNVTHENLRITQSSIPTNVQNNFSAVSHMQNVLIKVNFMSKILPLVWLGFTL